MSEQKHTPGPWAISDINFGCGYGIDGADGSAVVWLPGPNEHETGVPNKEDAHLIAAAPDLLEALKAFVNNSSAQTNLPSECERAEIVIAKAEGKPQ